ncbi:hypothetical protein Tco_1253863 [Tanacetum coccineum]
MKRHIEIVKDDEVAIDAITLATKPLVIVECQIDKYGRMGYFKLIRDDGSSKRYSSMIKMLQGIDREDLETLWKLVKAKHENKRPEEDYERVLWGDLKVMFEPGIKSEVWRNLQGYKVTVWKLFDNCKVHFIQKMNIKFRGGLLGLKDFKMILRVTTTQVLNWIIPTPEPSSIVSLPSRWQFLKTRLPQEGLAIIESKSKVRYSRSRANDSRVSTDAPLSNSSPSSNSFDMQQIAASLEDKDDHQD